MSILHVTTGANYNVTKTYIRFVNENFESCNHKFIVLDNPINIPSEFNNIDNIIIIDRNDKRYRELILNYIKSEETIILHSLCIDIYIQLFLLMKPSLIEKIIWVAWGMDLYQWKRKSNKIIYKIKNFITCKFRQRIKSFVGIFPPDIEFFKKEFQSNAKTFYASYTGNLYNNLYKSDLENINLSNKNENNDCFNIQIGHSSTQVLGHIEVLKQLEKYKEKNIKLYLPLSYGDKNYGDRVQQKAYELFGDKAICLREMMPKDDYMEYISTIDIAIFNTTRQIGLGNISPMLYMEKKIYMPKGSVMYDFYSSQQVDIWDYNEIDNLDYSEFIQPLRFKGGRKYIVDNELDLKHKINMWDKVFKAPLKRGI